MTPQLRAPRAGSPCTELRPVHSRPGSFAACVSQSTPRTQVHSPCVCVSKCARALLCLCACACVLTRVRAGAQRRVAFGHAYPLIRVDYPPQVPQRAEKESLPCPGPAQAVCPFGQAQAAGLARPRRRALPGPGGPCPAHSPIRPFARPRFRSGAPRSTLTPCRDLGWSRSESASCDRSRLERHVLQAHVPRSRRVLAVP